MRSSFLRFLVLGCGLLLVLPPGWCCMFASWGRKQDAPSARPCRRTCCGEENRSPTSTPTPRPAPRKPARCPCADRLSTVPDTAKVFAGDPPIVAPLDALDLSPAQPAVDSPVGFRSPSPPSATHILNCLWLC